MTGDLWNPDALTFTLTISGIGLAIAIATWWRYKRKDDDRG